MRIKKNDTVIVLKGKDRGKKGKVLVVDPVRGRITVEGLNIFKKHKRPTRRGQKGEVVMVPRGIGASNVALYCDGCKRGVRSGIRRDGASKVRICRTCKATL